MVAQKETVPQRLKPRGGLPIYDTAEAVSLTSLDFQQLLSVIWSGSQSSCFQ